MLEVFKNLANVKAYFSTRQNGFSQKPFESLNIAFHVGDKEEDVLKNHQQIKKHFPNHKNISYMKQIHSNIICEIGSLKDIPECDALITSEKGEILMTMVADCVPILIHDKKNNIIAAVHAGRAGAFENIVTETISQMKKTHETHVHDIYVAIGPHIHSCCYEVGSEILKEAEVLGLEEYIKNKNNSFYLDLKSLILSQLKSLDIKDAQIEIIDECTACHVDRYFSYRKEGQTGRFCGVIMLE